MYILHTSLRYLGLSLDILDCHYVQSYNLLSLHLSAVIITSHFLKSQA